MKIQDAISGLQTIASKYPDATVRGEIFDTTFSIGTGKLNCEVAITDEDTERARKTIIEGGVQ